MDDWHDVADADSDQEFDDYRDQEVAGESANREISDADWLGAEYNQGLRDMESLGLTDIGNLASWSVSSMKIGYGVESLRSENPELYWQSDGPQPHNIDVHFSKKVSIERISFYVDYMVDESYTPSKLVVYSGTGYHDLQQVSTLELQEPRGWSHIMMNTVRSDGVIKTFLVRLAILANHQHGKDTHIRALKLYSPMKTNLDQEIGFNTIAMLSETVIR
jgi:anaphase-promoting complex subunit 10